MFYHSCCWSYVEAFFAHIFWLFRQKPTLFTFWRVSTEFCRFWIPLEFVLPYFRTHVGIVNNFSGILRNSVREVLRDSAEFRSISCMEFRIFFLWSVSSIWVLFNFCWFFADLRSSYKNDTTLLNPYFLVHVQYVPANVQIRVHAHIHTMSMTMSTSVSCPCPCLYSFTPTSVSV